MKYNFIADIFNMRVLNMDIIQEKGFDFGFDPIACKNCCGRCCIGESGYKARPTQCRTFPFWEHFKKNTNEVIKECPGIKINSQGLAGE